MARKKRVSAAALAQAAPMVPKPFTERAMIHFEVLLILFEFLPQADVLRCTQVSKGPFGQAATESLYRHPVVYLHRMKTFYKMYMRNSRLSEGIKSLTILLERALNDGWYDQQYLYDLRLFQTYKTSFEFMDLYLMPLMPTVRSLSLPPVPLEFKADLLDTLKTAQNLKSLSISRIWDGQTTATVSDFSEVATGLASMPLRSLTVTKLALNGLAQTPNGQLPALHQVSELGMIGVRCSYRIDIMESIFDLSRITRLSISKLSDFPPCRVLNFAGHCPSLKVLQLTSSTTNREGSLHVPPEALSTEVYENLATIPYVALASEYITPELFFVPRVNRWRVLRIWEIDIADPSMIGLHVMLGKRSHTCKETPLHLILSNEDMGIHSTTDKAMFQALADSCGVELSFSDTKTFEISSDAAVVNPSCITS